MKNNILSILLICNLIVFGFLFSSHKYISKPAGPETLFMVEYSKGSKWDNKKDFEEQKFAAHHSGYLQKLRSQGLIRFGARYAEKGIIFIAAANIESAKRIVFSDSSVINKMFDATVNDLNIFYEYKAEGNVMAKIGEGKVTGIGGVFFKSKDPKSLNAWYYKNLGLAPNDYGSMFEWRTSDDKSIAYTQWSPFSSKTTYFKPSQKDYMINYRVDDMEKLFKKLKANGITIVDTIETYDYGKFLHILDCDSNKIELWQPVDASFEKLYQGKTTK